MFYTMTIESSMKVQNLSDWTRIRRLKRIITMLYRANYAVLNRNVTHFALDKTGGDPLKDSPLNK